MPAARDVYCGLATFCSIRKKDGCSLKFSTLALVTAFCFQLATKHPGRIFLHDRLHLLIQLRALALIGRAARGFQQLVHLRIGIVAGVEAALVRPGFGAQRQEGQRVRIVGHPGHFGHVRLAFEAGIHLAEEGVPLIGLDLDVHADGFEIGLDGRAHGNRIEHAGAALGDIEGQFLAVIAGIGQHLLGLFRIIGIGLEALVVGPGESRRRRACGNLGGALQDVVDQRGLVDRVVGRLADLLVGEGAFLGVEDQEPDVRAGLFMHDELGVRAELLQAVRRHLDHDVETARKHLGDTRIGVGDRPVDDRLEIGAPSQ
jgi:hypothetical protein